MTLRGSPLAWRLFEVGFLPWLRTRLAGVHLRGLPPEGALEPTLPLLLVANHTSWFDGFLLRDVHRRVRPAGPLRTVMLQKELRGRAALRFVGGTGFDPERPATFRAVLRELDALRGPPVAATVSFFPQGRIYPSFRTPLGFRPGVELLARHLRPLHILPVAIHLEGGGETRPRAFLSAAPLLTVRASSVAPTAEALDAIVAGETDRIRAFLAEWGEDSPARWQEGWAQEDGAGKATSGREEARTTHQPGAGEGPSGAPRLHPR